MVLVVLEFEVEYKEEEEDDEHVIWEALSRGGIRGGRKRMNRRFWDCYRSEWSSRRR